MHRSEDDIQIVTCDVEPILSNANENSSEQMSKCNRDIHSVVFILLLLAVALQLYMFIKALFWQQAVQGF